ncbi:MULTISPECIES: TRAP transporter small permease [unclassified Pseudoxanthomonas]|uniref:TRAP transporter small permease n=1 Tax=unclassified Pseudoxanthomonas TaxID=2645906 RepID=UPI0008E67FB4|nr:MULTISPECIES: TRAP transporter small permease [unclassified Pseudoxanthomonas]PPJ41431.1 TRAP transporter small permease [Pseudoxanthomonas sp. KAs_5_3]SFV30325.1 TRAP-type C4-dicarboxylate transport system, small permease component [Pseudoxanthomonas sp. YR558]
MTETAASVPAGPVQRALDRLADAAIAIAATALVGLVVVQGWQVFTRYVLNDSPSWTEPVTLLLLSTAMSLGAAAGVHTNRHFSFHLLAESLPAAGRRLLAVARPLLIAAVGAMVAGWAAVLLLDGLDIKIAGASMPQSINYLPLSISGALICLFALNIAWKALRPAREEGV